MAGFVSRRARRNPRPHAIDANARDTAGQARRIGAGRDESEKDVALGVGRDRRVDDDDAVVELSGRVVSVGAVEHHALESTRRRVDVVAVEELAAGTGNVSAIASGERDVEARRPIVRRKNVIGVGRPQQCSIEAGAGVDAEATGGAGLHGHEHRVARRDDRRAIVDQQRAVRRILGCGIDGGLPQCTGERLRGDPALRRMLRVTSVTSPGGDC